MIAISEQPTKGVMAITDDEVRTALRTAVAAAPSLRKWAKAHNLSPSYVSDVLSGARAPGEKVLTALGYERVTRPREESDA